MRSFAARLHCLPGLTLLLAATLAGVPATPASAGYKIDYVIYPYHEEIVDSWLFDINEQGESTGYISKRDDEENLFQGPVIYRNGEYEHLARGDFQNSAATNVGYAINDRGDVAGSLNFEFQYYPRNGEPQLIQSPDGYVNEIHGLNNNGGVLLSGAFDAQPATISQRFAVWADGNPTALTALDPLFPYLQPPDPNDFYSGPSAFTYSPFVTGINDSGQFAARVNQYYSDPFEERNSFDDVNIETFEGAFIYDGQGGYAMLAPPEAGDAIDPIHIDALGTVLGWANNPLILDDGRLAIWNADGTLQSLLPDPGVELSGSGRNNVVRNELGQVVAKTVDGGILQYDPATETWTDLAPLIENLDGGVIRSVQGFNSRGQIVGTAYPPNGFGYFGYVITPVPEPSGWALLAIGGGALAMLRRRRR